MTEVTPALAQRPAQWLVQGRVGYRAVMTERPHDVEDREQERNLVDTDRDGPLTPLGGTVDLPMLTDEERALIDAGGRLRYAVVRPQIEGPDSR